MNRELWNNILHEIKIFTGSLSELGKILIREEVENEEPE